MNFIQEFINDLKKYLVKAHGKLNSSFHNHELTQKKIETVETYIRDFEASDITDFRRVRDINPDILQHIRKSILRLQNYNIVLEIKYYEGHLTTRQNMLLGDNPVAAWFNSTLGQSNLHKITANTLAKIDDYLFDHCPDYQADLGSTAFLSFIQLYTQKIVWYISEELDRLKHLDNDKYKLCLKTHNELKALAIAFLDTSVDLSLAKAVDQLTLIISTLKCENYKLEEDYNIYHVSMRDNADLAFFKALSRRTLLQSRLNGMVEDFEDKIEFLRQTYGLEPAPARIRRLEYNAEPSSNTATVPRL